MPFVDAVTETWTIPWSEVGFRPAAPDALAVGPDLLAAGADGRVIFYDPVARELVTLQDGQITARELTDRLDDLFEAPDGSLLTVDHMSRRLERHDGRRVEELALPRLAPSHGALDLGEDGAILLRDVFGNGHVVGVLDRSGLVEAPAGRLRPPDCPVTWAAPRLLACGHPYLLPGTAKAAGRIVENGGVRWLVVEELVGEGPIAVRRWAVALNRGTRVDLPLGDRRYAPTDDLAVDADGRLVVMAPLASGLRFTRVSP